MLQCEIQKYLKMKKTLDYLKALGYVLIAISITWSLIATHSLRASQYMPTRYFLWTGIICIVPMYAYELWFLIADHGVGSTDHSLWNITG